MKDLHTSSLPRHLFKRIEHREIIQSLVTEATFKLQCHPMKNNHFIVVSHSWLLGALQKETNSKHFVGLITMLK